MKKKSFVIMGHATSISLEEDFWDLLYQISKLKKMSLTALITQIDQHRTNNLSSAVRVYILNEILNNPYLFKNTNKK